jgi:hypothetical protein
MFFGGYVKLPCGPEAAKFEIYLHMNKAYFLYRHTYQFAVLYHAQNQP